MRNIVNTNIMPPSKQFGIIIEPSSDSEDGGSNYVEVEATEAITVVPEIDGDEFGVKNFTISTTQDTSTSKDDKDLDTKSKLNVKERQQEAV